MELYTKFLNKNLSPKNSTSKKIKYFLTKHFTEKYLIGIYLVTAYKENCKPINLLVTNFTNY